MSRFIPGVGPSSAKLMIVGEAPGRYEDEQGLPFVGPSGEILEELLENVKIKRSSVYITNIVKVKPPENNLKKLNLIDHPKEARGYKIEDFLPLLWSEVEAIKPNIILGLGAIALKYLTGKEGIQLWRGSILSALDANCTKCVCTYHPAALFDRTEMNDDGGGSGVFNWKFKSVMEFDFKRAVDQSLFPEIRRKSKHVKICRNSLDLYRYLEEFGI